MTDKQECRELLALCLVPHRTSDDITFLQTELPDLYRRYIDITITWQIVCTTDKSIALSHNFQNTICLRTTV